AIAVALCGLIGMRYFNHRVGLVAALLFAVGPWAIQFARNLWPVPQPLFSALLLIGILEVAVRSNPWGWALTGLGIALVAGTHLGGVYVLPVVLIALVVGRRSFKIGPALIGALPIALVASAFFIHDTAHNFENLRAYAGAVGGGGARFNVEALRFAAWLSSGLGLSSLTGQAFDAWMREISTMQPLADALQVVWLATSCIWVATRIVRARGRLLAELIVFLWFVVPIALQLFSSRPVELQYLPVLLPAPFLLMAIAADDWLHLLQRLPRAVGTSVAVASLACLAMIAVVQISATLQFTAFIEQYVTTGGYGLPVRSALAARQAALDARASGEVNSDVIVVIDGFPTPWNEQAAILRAVMADVPYRFMSASGDGFIFRPDRTHYIFAPGTESLLEHIVAMVAPSAIVTRSIESQPGSGIRYTYALLREPIETSAFRSDLQATWENGVTLERYRISRAQDGRALRIESVLRVLQTPPEGSDYHWFNHVFVGDEKIAQVDGQGVHPFAWRAGDLMYQSFTLDLPDGAERMSLRVRLGSYTWPEIRNIAVHRPGKPPEDGVDILLAP
ncbi:MAG: hypothetical protein RMN25_13965, partial [Anaerolineae bacterium]|nr:glycosyltransferase family 39 protein [Thermoflexales bacterium]MDW8408877.1 hypothetical protein [Anaerolineae bacterium]